MKISKNRIDAFLTCVLTCESCITDCMTAGNKECVLLCRDCADICELYMRFEARGSRFGRSLHALCAEICKACAAECAKYASHHASCKECTEACEKCTEICKELASGMV